MELMWPWPQMAFSASEPTKLAYHVVRITLKISTVPAHTVRRSPSKGSSSSFGGVCITITLATRKDESLNPKTELLAEVRMGSQIVKPCTDC